MTTTTDPRKTAVSLPLYLGTFTWANIPAAAAFSGYMAMVSNLDAAPGTLMISNGTRWKTLSGTATLTQLGAPVAGITNSESIVLQTLIPAGAWQVGDTIRIELLLGKSGTTDSLNGVVYIGTAGTNSDAAVIPSLIWIPTASVGVGHVFDIKLTSVTLAQRQGTGPAGGLSSYSAANSTPQPAAVTISDASANALYISVGIKSSSTNNTVGIQGGSIQLRTP